MIKIWGSRISKLSSTSYRKIRLAWQNVERPYKLLTTAFLVITFILAGETLSESPSLSSLFELPRQSRVFGPIFFPPETVNNPIEWKDRVQSLLLLIGLPVAFLLWHWRDRNVRDQIENARKDTNLREYLEVQKMAAGLVEGADGEQSVKCQLQIAALHQIRGFLRGEYGESFRRPAFELLMSGHANAMERIGVKEVQKQISEFDEDISDDIWVSKERLIVKMNMVDKERLEIIKFEYDQIFGGYFNLSGKCFDFIDFTWTEFKPNLKISNASFFGATFFGCLLKSVNFEYSQLQAAEFHDCDLSNARLWGAHLDGGTLSDCILWGANIGIRDTASFPDCSGSEIDENCWMASNWGGLNEDEKEKVRSIWYAAGASASESLQNQLSRFDETPPVTDK